MVEGEEDIHGLGRVKKVRERRTRKLRGRDNNGMGIKGQRWEKKGKEGKGMIRKERECERKVK